MQHSGSVIIDAWNTVLFEKFHRFRHLLVDGLSQHSDAALQRLGYAPGASVVDIGCGFGDTALLIGEYVGPTGTAVGVDCAERFISAAEEDRRKRDADNVRFFVGDVQSEALGGPFDHAFSRFGTMFFEMPGAAMRNVRKALRPGGTFTQIVWRRREDNPWLFEAEQRVREIVPVRSAEDSGEVHCGPGPFSMADSDTVSAMLRSAGFERIGFERYDCDICIGHDLDDAVAFAMALGPAGEIIRLAGVEGERRRPEVEDALRAVLAPFACAHGVWAPSSTWFVTASNPV